MPLAFPERNAVRWRANSSSLLHNEKRRGLNRGVSHSPEQIGIRYSFPAACSRCGVLLELCGNRLGGTIWEPMLRNSWFGSTSATSVGVTTLRPERRVGAEVALDADELTDHPAVLRIIAAEVADGSAVLRIGKAIERRRALLDAAGAERADGGVDLDVVLLDLLRDLFAARPGGRRSSAWSPAASSA